MTPRVLVAGVGNIFFGDDGFGVEVAQRLALEPQPAGVEIVDYGIRGLHLAFRLLDPLDLLLVVDAMRRGDPPGTVTVLEPELDAATLAVADAHGVDLPAVFEIARSMGARVPRSLVVGCEPDTIDGGIGLSPTVQRAVPRAVDLVRELASHAIFDREAAS